MRRRLIFWSVITSIILAATVIRAIDIDPVVRLRLLAFDTFQRLAPRPRDPSYPVRIVDIDEKSITSVGNWPWTRDQLGQLVDRLNELGAHVIAFDFVFPSQQSSSLCALGDKLAAFDALKSVYDEIVARCSADQKFAASFKDRRVILGLIGRSGSDNATVPQRAGFALIGDNPRAHVPTFSSVTANYSVLQNATAGLGALNWFPESDQIVRRVPMIVGIGEQLVPSLTAESLRLALDASTITVFSSTASGEFSPTGETGITSIAINDVRFPTDRDGQIWLSFNKHDPNRFRSAVDVLEGRVPRQDIEGRVVLVGTSAPGLFDLRATPLDASLAGVEVHAQALEQLFQGRMLYRPDYSPGLEMAFMLVGASAIALSSYLGGALMGAILGGLAVAGVFGTAWWSFNSLGILIDPVYPSVTMTAVYIFATAFLYFQTEQDRRQIRQAFSQYMAPSLVRQLTRDPTRLQLGGETRELTIMFSDVRGFTNIAESYRHDPRGLTRLMNRLLNPLTYAIMERNGTIDKYIGDAIMAFWNAPLDDAAHARNGCESALQMLQELAGLNDERRAEAEQAGEDFIPLRLGIGLATGVGMVGNMGSDIRFDYSVLGDTVNLASRLEGLTRSYGVPVLLSDATCRDGGAGLAVFEVDRVQVAGRESVEAIWALVGGETLASDAQFAQFNAGFVTAIEHYRQGDWSAARDALNQLRPLAEALAIGGLIDCFLERIAGFEATPPPSSWDGVTRMQK
ncbi:MAG: CHASE2 domain-containing protein [Hyphomicrobiaceae bacterium]